MPEVTFPKQFYGRPAAKSRYNPNYCAEEEVITPPGLPLLLQRSRQCTKVPGHGDRNLFCKQHAKVHPDTDEAGSLVLA